MEIEFQNNIKDYKKFYLARLTRKLIRNSIIITVISLFLSLNIFILQTQLLEFAIFLIISPLILLIIFHVVPRLFTIKKLYKLIHKIDNLYEKKRLIVTEEGIVIECQNKSDLFKWNDIHYIYSKYKFINLVVVGNKLLIIPFRFFSKYEDVKEFVKTIKIKLEKT